MRPRRWLYTTPLRLRSQFRSRDVGPIFALRYE